MLVLGVDLWVPGTDHAFNQICPEERPLGPGRSGRSVWVSVSRDSGRSSRAAVPGGVVLFAQLLPDGGVQCLP